MINAMIQNKHGEIILWRFPGSIYALHSELLNIGISTWPSNIKLTDEEDDPIQVKLYANSDIGNHLIQLLSEKHSLEDVETVASAVEKANALIKEELVQQIIMDQYASPDELFADIRQMLYEAGSVSETFYFPLIGCIYNAEDGEGYQISNSHLQMFESEIREKLDWYQDRDTENMAQYYDGNGGEKLLLADWGLAFVGGELYGKVDVRLTEPMTPEEREQLKDWISGQNSDGLGEGFEQQDIETEDGSLNVSFWHSGDDYFVYDREEMDGFTGGQLGQQMGGM